MVYRFMAKQAGSQRTIEVQSQGPAGVSVDKVKLALRTSLSQQGIEVDWIEYIGSVDTDVEGLVVPVEEINPPSALSEKLSTPTILGWYSPIGNAQANNKCVVSGCNRDATYHLCEQHAVPGTVVEVNGEGFVVSDWLAERAGQMCVIRVNDFALGDLYGGRQELEHQLSVQGYKVHGLISSEEEMEAAKKRYPGLQITRWPPNLPGEDSK
jgi:hypothetical protein